MVNKTLLESEVTAMDNDHTGQFIFAGDSQVYTFYVQYSDAFISEVCCFDFRVLSPL